MAIKENMGITPNVPGTGPATDVPNPSNDPYRNEPGAPDIKPGGDVPGEPGGGPSERDSRFQNPRDTPVPLGIDPNKSINPSGPSTGTEGWGLGPGEAETTGVGQGGLGKPRRDPVTHTPAARADSSGPETRTFRCADVGNADCRWEVSGRTADELLPAIARHGREQHGRELDEKTRRKVLDAIHERRAA